LMNREAKTPHLTRDRPSILALSPFLIYYDRLKML